MHSSTPEEASSTIPSSATARILVIDDEMGPRESLRMILKDSYEIVCTDSGEAGIEKFKEGGFDLVLLDLKMKRMSGMETLEKLKEIDPSINVVILTGYGTLETAQKAIRLGADDYVSKPFDVVELSKTVKQILTKKRDETAKGIAVDKLRGLNHTLEEEIQSLQKILSSQEQYRSFFHEICNPLTSVLGYVQILLLELEEKKQFGKEDRNRAHNYLRIIENEMERCRLMLRSFSSVSKKREEKTKSISLAALIDEILLLLSPQMGKSDIRSQSNLDHSSSMIPIRSGEIRQVILNLCINAIHAMPTGGTLSLTARCVPAAPTPTVEIEVADTGCGIDEPMIEKVFEPFFSTKSPDLGSGLGLSISKNIIEKFGGTIRIKSRKGDGTRVTISIPIRNPI